MLLAILGAFVVAALSFGAKLSDRTVLVFVFRAAGVCMCVCVCVGARQAFRLGPRDPARARVRRFTTGQTQRGCELRV